MILINIKKIIFYLYVILIFYILITAIVFSFSYISLVNGKTYDMFWIKSIQKKLYFRGYRNILHYDKNCIRFDKNLLYKPKSGVCNFKNAEFDTKLTFGQFSRIHETTNSEKIKKTDLVILGDSISMGWGVNDNETFSYHLQNLLKKKVFNMGVSSYGTVREIKRLKQSPYYEDIETIIIQYHRNDMFENIKLDINKQYGKDEYNENFNYEKIKNTNIKFILRNYKSAIRLFFSDIIDIIFKEENLELMNFDYDKEHLDKVITKNIDLNNKRVIVIVPIAPWQKLFNFPIENREIEYLLIKLNNEHFFIIDDHPNVLGHKEIASKIYDYLNTD